MTDPIATLRALARAPHQIRVTELLGALAELERRARGTWRATHTAPFGERVLYAVKLESWETAELCLGIRKQGTKRTKHIGLVYPDDAERNDNTWTDLENSAEGFWKESDVIGWKPLPELPTEKVR